MLFFPAARKISSVTGGLLLDLYPGALGAWSLRKLRTLYSGAAVRVRRSSDNSQQDIGFSGNNFDVAGFNAFVNGSVGYITRKYDQSLNGNNGSQITEPRQQELKVNSFNGVSSIDFISNGLDLGIQLPSIYSVFLVCKYNALSAAPGQRVLSSYDGGAIDTGEILFGGRNTPSFELNQSGASIISTPGDLNHHQQTAIGAATDLTLRIDGVDIASVPRTPEVATNNLALGVDASFVGAPANAHIPELIMYPMDNSLNAPAIELIQKLYYGTL